MRDTPAEISNLQIVIHNDDETPFEFVIDLVRSLFGRSQRDVQVGLDTLFSASQSLPRSPAQAGSPLWWRVEFDRRDRRRGRGAQQGVSTAFIKELMRRTAQSRVRRGGSEMVTSGDLAEALDDMLFTGGRLNVKLLGGADGGPPYRT